MDFQRRVDKISFAGPFPSGKNRASNAPVNIHHGDGTTELAWNIYRTSNHGLSVEIGRDSGIGAGPNPPRSVLGGLRIERVAEAVTQEVE